MNDALTVSRTWITIAAGQLLVSIHYERGLDLIFDPKYDDLPNPPKKEDLSARHGLEALLKSIALDAPVESVVNTAITLTDPKFSTGHDSRIREVTEAMISDTLNYKGPVDRLADLVSADQRKDNR